MLTKPSSSACSSKSATIIFGPTQYGKSSFICNVLRLEDVTAAAERRDHRHDYPRLDLPKIGNGGGTSITRVCKTYSTRSLGLLLDTAGYNDTGLHFPDTGKLVALELAKYYLDVEQVRFLVFESLADSSIQLRATLVKLLEAFGDEAKQSIVVVATKLDRADDDELDDRLANIEQIMAEVGIKQQQQVLADAGDGYTTNTTSSNSSNLVTWKNKKFSLDEFARQLGELKACLETTPPTKIQDLEDIHTKVKIRAEELCAKQVPKKKTHYFEEEEPYIVDYKKMVSYQDKEYEYVCVDEGHKMLIDKNFAGGVATYAGTLGIGFLIDASLTATRPPRHEMREKMVTKHREETHYETKTRLVEKSIVIESEKKPVEAFLAEAHAQILKELNMAYEAKEEDANIVVVTSDAA